MKTRKLLIILLYLSGAFSALNIVALLFSPIFFPFANFTVVKFAIGAYYGYFNPFCLIISLLLIVLIFLSARFLNRHHILFSLCPFAISLGDFIHAGWVFLADLLDDYFNALPLGPILVDAAIVVLLIRYVRIEALQKKEDPGLLK